MTHPNSSPTDGHEGDGVNLRLSGRSGRAAIRSGETQPEPFGTHQKVRHLSVLDGWPACVPLIVVTV